jgi:hypothetical protein
VFCSKIKFTPSSWTGRFFPERATGNYFIRDRTGGQIEVRECLLPFGAESFVFQFAIQKLKDQDIYNYNFARCFVWV